MPGSSSRIARATSTSRYSPQPVSRTSKRMPRRAIALAKASLANHAGAVPVRPW